MKETYNNYDNVAGYYDTLAGFIFGRSLRQSQVCLLQFVQDNDRILIAGGGTGWLLDEINTLNKKGLQIVFVDASEKMIRIAQQRNTPDLSVQFITSPIDKMEMPGHFSIIITPFLFDNFKTGEANKNFNILHQVLTANGLWLFTDFHINLHSPFWQKWLLAIMYRFFSIAAAVKTTHLPDTTHLFNQYGYQLMHKALFYRRFIEACAWRKK